MSTLKNVGRSLLDENASLEAALAAKDAEIARLLEALRPFADAHFYYSDASKPDDCRTGISGITYGDFRRALSVLAALDSPAPQQTSEERDAWIERVRSVDAAPAEAALATGWKGIA